MRSEKYGRVFWITRAAVLVALLIVLQYVTAFAGVQLLTGAVVNMMLIISAACGLTCGLTVAALSPVFAKLFGIGPFWSFIPFIILGNAAFVAVRCFIGVIGEKFFARRRAQRHSEPSRHCEERAIAIGSEESPRLRLLRKYGLYAVAVIAAAVVKFVILYVGVAKIAVPYIMKLPEPQASVIAGMFSLQQLLTALVGGALAGLILPALEKAGVFKEARSN